MWLPTAICVLFIAEAAWRFAIPTGPGGFNKPSACFNGFNFLALGLLGLGCLYAPKKWFSRSDAAEDAEAPAPAAAVGEEESGSVAVVVVEGSDSPETAARGAASKSTGVEGGMFWWTLPPPRLLAWRRSSRRRTSPT